MEVKSTIKQYWGELVYIFSNSYSMVISMVASLIATAFIEPEDMGVIQKLLLVQVYFSFLQLGVYNGLNRNIAFYKAQKEEQKVQDMVNTSYTVAAVVSLVGFLIAISILVYYLYSGASIVYIFASIMLAILLVFGNFSNMIDTTFRSGQQFKQLGNLKNIESTVYAVLSLLPIVLGYIGKIISDCTRQVLGFILRYKYKPYNKTGLGSFDSLKLLIYTGFPMLVSGYVWTVFVACDSTFIASHLTTRDLGLYALSGYVSTAVMVIPNAVNALLYPKAAARYGETGDKRSLLPFWKKSILIYIAILVPVCAVLYFVLPYIIPLLMPKYVGGIKAAQYSLLTCMTFISFGPSVIFGTLRRNKLYIVLMLASIGLFWLVATLCNSWISSIEAVSLLRFLISFIQMVCILIITYIYIK